MGEKYKAFLYESQMKQLYLLLYVLVSEIEADISSECSECGDPLSTIHVWTDNSTVWKREEFTSECGLDTSIICTRENHLGGDLYVMFFKSSPDVIGINPFFVNKTLGYHMRTKIVCKQGKWLHEDFDTPISHALCDQFINPSFSKVAITTTPDENVEETIAVTNSSTTEHPTTTTTNLNGLWAKKVTVKTTLLPTPTVKPKKVLSLFPPVQTTESPKEIPLIQEKQKNESIVPKPPIIIMETTKISATKTKENTVIMSDRRESLEDRPFSPDILQATLSPGYDEFIPTSTTEMPLSLTPGSSFILFNGQAPTAKQNRRTELNVQSVDAKKLTCQPKNQPKKNLPNQQRRRIMRKKLSRKTSRVVRKKTHQIQH